jgi:hypothetical protein
MAKLSSKARGKIPSKEFAGPGRSFPIEDKAHARAAIRLAPYSYDAGNISKAVEEHIIGKAKRKLNQ